MKGFSATYKIVFLALFLIPSLRLVAQDKSQEFHNYFYDQRRSFFESVPDTKNEIILLGDSLTNCANWEELFPDVNIKNRGISGDITFGVLDRIEEVISSKPKQVFILIGINDISRNIPLETILANYQAIIDRIQKESPRTKIYIQSVFPTNDGFTQFKTHQGKTDQIILLNGKLEVLAHQKKVDYINLYPVFSDEFGKLNKDFTNDGLHLLGKGYAVWAKNLKKYFNQ